MRTDLVFQFDSTDHGTIDWKYHDDVKEKMYYAQWMVKKRDVVVLTKLPADIKKIVHTELFESFAEENQQVRDHNNKKARERRARRNNGD
tara:strand:- start:122 stop:391 length:270 start_codon:yes stop_codon:yes gene_type:complete